MPFFAGLAAFLAAGLAAFAAGLAGLAALAGLTALTCRTASLAAAVTSDRENGRQQSGERRDSKQLFFHAEKTSIGIQLPQDNEHSSEDPPLLDMHFRPEDHDGPFSHQRLASSNVALFSGTFSRNPRRRSGSVIFCAFAKMHSRAFRTNWHASS